MCSLLPEAVLPYACYLLRVERGTSCVWQEADGESGAHPWELQLCPGLSVLFVWGWPAAQAAASVLGPGHLGTRPGCKSERTPCSVAGPSLGGIGLGTAASEAPRVLG